MNRSCFGSVFTILTLLFLAPNPVIGWSGTGHMVVAEIAHERLSPRTKEEVDRLIAVLAPLDPAVDHFVPSSVWMDQLRGNGLDAFNTWHYINLPITAADLATGDHSINFPNDENVVWAIERSLATLSDSPASTQDFPKALMLRILIHLVGDVHQPLHAATLVTRALPTGDRGGNDFLLAPSNRQALLSCPDAKKTHPKTEEETTDPERRLNLHAFWDQGAHALPSLEWPQDADCVTFLARTITARFPPHKVPHWNNESPETWARESHALALTHVYSGLEPDTAPEATYVQRAQPIVLQRLAVAGYRLAAALERTFQNR